MFAAEQVADIQIATLPKLAIPLLGPVFFTQNILTYLAYLMIPAALFLLYRTSLGLTLRSTGENPVAVDVAGLNVNRIRFLTVLVAGAVSGLAGSFYTVGYLGMFTSNIIGGRGWIALAIVTCAMWKPSAAMITAYVFGGMEALAYQLQAISIAVSPVLLKMLPYLATVIVLVIVSIANRKKGVTGPEAMTIPFSPEDS